MSKKTKKTNYLIIAIIIVLFIILCLAYDEMKVEPADANTVNSNLVDENTGLDNIINELFEDVTTNQEVENKNEEDDENIQKENSNTENEDNTNELDNEENEIEEEDISSTETVTSKEQKAINLVKQAWGGDDGVYFSNESIDSNGRYIISVRDRGTTNSLAFFLVDVDSGLVTKQ